ncbi:MAG: phosphotransferase [Gammaproteobacteria bacterium]
MVSECYTLNMGPSIALPGPEKIGSQGSVKKYMAVNTGEVFAFKTLVMKEERDLIRFKREHDALEALGLLKDVIWPKKVGDKGRLAFPFHEGETFYDYVNRYTKIEKDIEIALLIIEEVKKIHDKGYAHNSLHTENILIDEKERDIRVHLIDYGRSLPNEYCDDLERDHEFLSDILAMLFEYIDHYPQNVIKQIRGLIANMDASTYLDLDTITDVLKQAKLERDVSMSDKSVTPTASSFMIYTEAFNALLAQHQIVLSLETRQAHERAFAEHPESTKPIHRKSDHVDLSLFNLPDIGPSIPFQNSKCMGWCGSVRKHLAISGKVFALKTIRIHEAKDLELFRQELKALSILGLLEGVAWPKKIGDKGRLAFPFYEGRTLIQYIRDEAKTGRHIEKDIEIALLIIDELIKMNAQGLCHGDLHLGNIIVGNGNDINVYLIDFGKSACMDDTRFASDQAILSKTFGFLFKYINNDHPIKVLIKRMDEERDIPLKEISGILRSAYEKLTAPSEPLVASNDSSHVSNVVSFSAKSDDADLTSDEKKKFHFFRQNS